MRNLNFIGNDDDKAIAINYIETNNLFNKNEINVNYHFSTFKRPSYFNSSNLNIVVDHNFEIEEIDNVIIIDHHLMETEFNKIYKSNTFLMLEKYKDIYEVVGFLYNKYNVIDIYIHTDIDGICSGLIVQHILMSIFDDKKIDDVKYESDLKLVLALGNYGDIADNAKLDLDRFLNTSSTTELDIYDKKISKFCNGVSRFMKAVRTGLIEYENRNKSGRLMFEYEIKLNPYGIKFDDIMMVISNIYIDMSNITNVNAKSVLLFMNSLAQNHLINKIVEIYNNETELVINNYMEPNIPSMEMKIMFKEDENKNTYKLLFVESPFDIGRSIIWKYNTSYTKTEKTSSNNISPWYYKITDWVKSGVKKYEDIVDPNRSYVCYNKTLKKLSINGIGAFNIAKDIFGGGGHITSNSESSLGSVVIENENIFYDSFVIVDIY